VWKCRDVGGEMIMPVNIHRAGRKLKGQVIVCKVPLPDHRALILGEHPGGGYVSTLRNGQPLVRTSGDTKLDRGRRRRYCIPKISLAAVV